MPRGVHKRASGLADGLDHADIGGWLGRVRRDLHDTAERLTPIVGESWRRDLGASSFLFPEWSTAISSLEAILDTSRQAGLDSALAAIGPSARLADLALAWILTPTWDESRRMLVAHRELLSDPHTEEVLRAFATRDEDSAAVASQHGALLALSRRLNLDDTYDIVTDLDAATEAAWDTATGGDGACWN